MCGLVMAAHEDDEVVAHQALAAARARFVTACGAADHERRDRGRLIRRQERDDDDGDTRRHGREPPRDRGQKEAAHVVDHAEREDPLDVLGSNAWR